MTMDAMELAKALAENEKLRAENEKLRAELRAAVEWLGSRKSQR